ncbi:unnamed protein product [Lactuca virosa]|uniref:Uncharacterized protein n=1 Tax=Lactuca virosa TaxID=75947 RepID=A0AAU9LWI0_9ASTR|nr:unnamed protein product [Lactuca virosa]
MNSFEDSQPSYTLFFQNRQHHENRTKSKHRSIRVDALKKSTRRLATAGLPPPVTPLLSPSSSFQKNLNEVSLIQDEVSAVGSNLEALKR